MVRVLVIMTPSTSLFYCTISFIIGIAFEFLVAIPQAITWGILLLAAVGIVASFFTKKQVAVMGFCMLFFIIGSSRLQVAEFAIAHDKVSQLNDSPDKITLQGQIIDEPDVRDTSQKLKVRISNTESIILVTVNRYPEYRYLDTLAMTGKLKTPSVNEDFDYQKYLRKEGIYSVMDYPSTKLVDVPRQYTPFTWAYEKLLAFKGGLKQSINLTFAPPQSLIVQGIILGGSAGFSQELKQQFTATGLTHLTAISGSNVVILSNILMVFLLGVGLWRSQAFYGAVTFVWLYVIIAGLPASGVRAAIMATVFLLAQKLGRQNTTGRVIVLTAAIMLLLNPLLLAYDAGFQLSFLASLGIIYVKPLFDQLFSFITHEQVKYFMGIFSVTMAAQLCTLPLVAYYFGTVSLVSPLTNILIIPIIDVLMVFGFLAAFLGLFSPALAFVISLPAWLLLMYFMKILELFGQPWAAVSLQNIPIIWLLLYYASLGGLLKYAQTKLRNGFLGY